MRYWRHKKGTWLLLGKYTANLTKSYQFFHHSLPRKFSFHHVMLSMILPLKIIKFVLLLGGKHVSKCSAVSAALPEINLQPLHALHSSTTRGPCLPSHSKTICYEELTLTSLQSAYRSMMYRGWAWGSCFRQDPQTDCFRRYGQRMFQNITKIPQMVQVNF